MSAPFSASLFLPDENATTELGVQLARVLQPGDTILLKGSVGAGKSHLARAIIQARLGYPEDVPSPTYTLVQTYQEAQADIFHADLYRLSDTSEFVELGLDDAFSSAICLVEWAERLGKDAPHGALVLELTMQNNGRLAAFSSDASRWDKVARAIERAGFLIDAGWSGAEQAIIAGDLSSRSYQRLSRDGQRGVLMDAGRDVSSVSSFLEISAWLTKNGYSAPNPIAQAQSKGLLLLDDFGDQQLSAHPDVDELMGLCLKLLADIRTKAPPNLPCPSAYELVEMTQLAEHYPGADATVLSGFRKVLLGCIESVTSGVQPTVSLRDFHADNIMWLGDKDGIQRLGLLDFQDAFLVHPVYDLVSLLTDARRDVSRSVRQSLIVEYAQITGDDLEELQKAFAIFSVQRNLRILGIFTRAALELGKPHHVPNLPRVYAYLAEALRHRVFENAGTALMAALPKPEKALLDRLAA